MRFKQRKELADKYREWVKQAIDNNQTMILDGAESLLAWLDVNGYLKDIVKCSECVWSRIKQTEHCKYMICDLTNIVISEVYPSDFYCAFGERREDDTQN